METIRNVYQMEFFGNTLQGYLMALAEVILAERATALQGGRVPTRVNLTASEHLFLIRDIELRKDSPYYVIEGIGNRIWGMKIIQVGELADRFGYEV